LESQYNASSQGRGETIDREFHEVAVSESVDSG